MGKASRRERRSTTTSRRKPVPFVARPFEGLPGESDWVALREILPAATLRVTLAAPYALDGVDDVRIATVLPMAWPGLHRSDGVVYAATQAGSSSGDASRDLAAQVLAAAALPAGTPLTTAPVVTADSPRLQDVLDVSFAHEVALHEGFDFWVEGQELGAAERESLERANEAALPTVRLEALPSAYWVAMGQRCYIRLVLPQDEDAATNALARLSAAGENSLGDDTRLLGAFRACGLLIPVWEVEPDLEAASHEDALAAFDTRYARALTEDAALDAQERRARAGLLSRQVTLR